MLRDGFEETQLWLEHALRFARLYDRAMNSPSVEQAEL